MMKTMAKNILLKAIVNSFLIRGLLIMALISPESSCAYPRTRSLLNSQPKKITIWIHGSNLTGVFLQQLVGPETLGVPEVARSKWLQNFICFYKKTPISKVLEWIKKEIRQARDAHDMIFDCPTGLNHATLLSEKCLLRATALTIYDANPERFPLDSFYTFGWCGERDYEIRQAASEELYKGMKLLLLSCPEKTEITIITHSHGGNVALNLAQFAERDAAQNGSYPFAIKELILLACPVQVKTRHYVDSAFFENIYAFHSHQDNLQIVDPQGLHVASLYLQKLGKGLIKFIKTQSFDQFKLAWKLEHKQTPLLSERHFPLKSKVKHVHPIWDKKRPWGCTDLAIFPKQYHDMILHFFSNNRKSRIATNTSNTITNNIANTGDTSDPIKTQEKSKPTRLKKKKTELSHIEFLLPSFLEELPRMLGIAESTELKPPMHQKSVQDIEILL